jgi:hypothetical protein
MDDAEINAGHPLGIRTGSIFIGGHRDLDGHIDEELGTDVDQGDRTDAGLVVRDVAGEAQLEGGAPRAVGNVRWWPSSVNVPA